MPTNVTPQYREAEERFRQAKTLPEKIAALQEMLAVMPKHKGTDHLKAQLRSRMSKLMEELEGPSRSSRSGRTEPFALPKQGAGRATLIGPANVGKSLLLSKATGAHPKVGAYALSTREPVPGMLSYEDINIQLVDTPPISNRATQGRLYGLLRTSDVFVVVCDLSGDPISQAYEAFSALREWGFRLLGKGDAREEDQLGSAKPVILVGNKADVLGGLDQFQLLEAEFGDDYPVRDEIRAMYKKRGQEVQKVMASTVMYNRGLLWASLHVEAIRNALKANGGKQPTGEDVKKGFEQIKGFTLGGLVPPLEVTATDHEGGGYVQIFQVKDGKFVKATEWFRAYPEVVAKAIKASE